MKRITSFLLALAMTIMPANVFAKENEPGVSVPSEYLNKLSMGVEGQKLEDYTVEDDKIVLEYGVTPYTRPEVIIPPSMENEYNSEEETVSIQYGNDGDSGGISVMAVGDYRLRTANSKATGLVNRASKNAGSISAAQNIVLTVFSVKFPMASTIISTASWFSDTVKSGLPVKSIIYTSHETNTKYGEMQKTNGVWTPYVAIAQRKYYKHTWASYTDSKGYQRQRIRDYTPSTGYGAFTTKTKANYGNNSWIQTKTKEMYKKGSYYYDTSF